MLDINPTTKKIINYLDVTEYIFSCKEIDEMNALTKEISSHLGKNDIDREQSIALLELIKSHVKTLNKLDTVKTLKFFPKSSISNKAGTISVVFLLFNISILAIMFTFMFLARR